MNFKKEILVQKKVSDSKKASQTRCKAIKMLSFIQLPKAAYVDNGNDNLDCFNACAQA